MNRMLTIALLVVNLIVLGMAVRVVGAYRSAVPYQATSLTVTTSAFTYQGRLQHNGQPVTGPCDFSFDLFDASDAGKLIAGQDLKAMPVTAGLFTVVLDFGPDAFNGGPRWLETTVQCDEAEGTWTLAPRQPITVAPIALSARNLTTDASPQLEGKGTPGDPLLSVINHGDGAGLRARSDNGPGVAGSSPTGPGVIGTSGTGPGLSGNTTHGTGVYGYGYASDAVGVTAEGNNGAPAMKAIGNALQDKASHGLPKAMLYVSSAPNILYCYNGITGETFSGESPNACGFSVIFDYHAGSIVNGYVIDFGFDVTRTFPMVTVQTFLSADFPVIANVTLDQHSATQWRVFTWYVDGTPTTSGFWIVVY